MAALEGGVSTNLYPPDIPPLHKPSFLPDSTNKSPGTSPILNWQPYAKGGILIMYTIFILTHFFLCRAPYRHWGGSNHCFAAGKKIEGGVLDHQKAIVGIIGPAWTKAKRATLTH